MVRNNNTLERSCGNRMTLRQKVTNQRRWEKCVKESPGPQLSGLLLKVGGVCKFMETRHYYIERAFRAVCARPEVV